MLALLLALLPVLTTGGLLPSVSAALSSLTIAQWIGIGFDIIKAGPEVANAIKALHPAFKDFIADLEADEKNIVLAAHGAHANIAAWMKDNAATIPGYAPDGSVVGIPNPDKP